jgi:tRNA U55 pseudouridine synthase TruB
MLPNLKSVYLDSDQTRDIKLGKKIEYPGFSTSHKLKLYDHNKQFLGIGESNPISEIQPKRLFVEV